MEQIFFALLTEPTLEIAEAFTRWENDPSLIPLTRPNRDINDLERRDTVTPDQLTQRLQHHHIYLIYRGSQLLGEMNYQIDPPHLFKREPGTAWLGITIGEGEGRGKGIGYQALQYLEQQVSEHGFRRIELGVFEFNVPAIAVYRKLGYQEMGRIPDFTYWEGKMWQDIRMEKYVQPS
jgi:RimJ/RimL family protein N-acetyltransferase